MPGLLPLVAFAILLQPGDESPKRPHDIIRVQVEGSFGITSRKSNDKDANASATIMAGGGEFVLDFRECPDGQKRLNEYFNNSGGAGWLVGPKVKVSGRLEFHPKQKSGGEIITNKARLVVESMSVLDTDRK